MASREEFQTHVRQVSSTTGVPYELLYPLAESESSANPNIGLHGVDSTAFGPMGITKGFAQQYGPGLDRTDWRQNVRIAAQGIQQLKDRYGTWEKAIEAYKLGSVGNAEMRAKYPAEYGAAQKVAARFQGTDRVLTAPPFGGAAPDNTRVNPFGQLGTLYGNVAQAQQQIEQLANQPMGYPRRPLPPERTAMGTALPGFLADLATAFSGNPLYQAGFAQQLQQEQQQRQAIQEQNFELSTQEIQQQRSQMLQAKMGQLELAKARLEAAGQWEMRDAIDQRQAALMKEMETLRGKQEMARIEREGELRMEQLAFSAGLKKDENGNWMFDPALFKKPMTEGEIQDNINKLLEIEGDKKTRGDIRRAANAQRMFLQFELPRPGDNIEAVEARLEGEYKDTAQRGMALLTIVKQYPWLRSVDGTNAADWAKAFEDAMKGKPGGPTTPEGQAPPEEISPAAKREQAFKEPVRTPLQQAQYEVKSIERNLQDLERYYEQHGRAPDTEYHEKLYKNLLAARKRLQTIQEKGALPDTTKK